MEQAQTLKEKLIKPIPTEMESIPSIALGVLEKDGMYFQVMNGEKAAVEARRICYAHLNPIYVYHVLDVPTQDILEQLIEHHSALTTYIQAEYNSI